MIRLGMRDFLLGWLGAGLAACGATDQRPATDAAALDAGAQIFRQQCSGCHAFGRNGIGPDLSGITRRADAGWVRRFIQNPQALLEAGDPRAAQLVAEYKTVMPSFAALDPGALDALVAYLYARPDAPASADSARAGSLPDPIPARVPASGLLARIELVTQLPATAKEAPLARIAKLESLPGSDDLCISDLRGRLYRVADGRAMIYLDLARQLPAFVAQPGLATGLGSFAFHPRFLQNGLLYTTHAEEGRAARADFALPDTVMPTLQWVLSEWKTADPRASTFIGSRRELLRIEMVAGIHGVQEIGFRPGARDPGLLYIGVGDGGCVENGHPQLTGRPDRVWGSLLRIDPAGRNSANGRYGLPASNPFAGATHKGLGELYAYGFRNPNHFSWAADGRLLLANIGQAKIESVYEVRPGGHHGWPLREGRFALQPSLGLRTGLEAVWPLPADERKGDFVYPVLQYDHDEGKAVAGGFVVGAVPGLQGQYVFGDVPTGRLFLAPAEALRPGREANIQEWHLSFKGKRTDLKALCGSGRVDLHFGQDALGKLYLMTKADGKVYRVTGADRR